MTHPYRRIFSVPGTAAFSSAGMTARLGTAMTRFGIVGMFAQRPGEYALAGSVTATQAIAYAVVGPRIARTADRRGQRRVLLPSAAVGAAALVALAVCHRWQTPVWTYFLAAVVAGVIPNVGAMVRARWAHLFHGSEDLHPAYSLESVVDEFSFTFGPVAAIGLSTGVSPEAGLVAAALLLVLGSWLLSRQRATEPPAGPATAGSGGGSAIRHPGMPALLLAFFAIGGVFASIEVATIALAAEHGHKAMASPVLAVYAVGSALGGLVYGSLRPVGTLSARLLAGTVLMTLTMTPLPATHGLLLLGVVLFVSGTVCAPSMATALGAVELAVPPGKVTEGMTWSSTGVYFGIALGASLAGTVVDRSGATAAFAVPVGCGVLAVAGVLAALRPLRAAARARWELPAAEEATALPAG